MISVLLVDDEPALLELAKFFLEKSGDITTSSVPSAKDAAHLMAGQEFDAVVCDYQMPEMDGLEFLKALRNQKNDIPFVLFTGKGREDVAIEALNSGADFYLQKGGDPNSQFAELANMVRASVAAQRAEKELKRSEAEHRRLVMTVPCLICRIAPDGKTLFVNDYVVDLTGYAPEELLGRNWWDILYPGHLRAQVDALLQEFRSGDVTGREMTLAGKDGSLKTVLWNSFNTRADDGKTILEVNGAVVDVTPRKAAENALRESGAFNRAVLDSLDANIAVLDGSGAIIAVNKSWLVFAGLNDADLSRVGVGADYIGTCERAASRGDEIAGRVAEALRDVLKGAKSSFSLEYPCDSPGGRRWFMLQASPLPKRRGGAVASHIDITARKTMEEALRASEAHYRSIFETTGSAMVIIDDDSTIVLVNSEFEKLSGYSKAEVQGKVKWTAFLEGPDRERLTEYHRARMRDPSAAPPTYQFRAKDRFGAEKALLANAAVVPGTNHTVVSILDETERRRYEDAIQQAGKKLDLLARITRHDILNQLAVLSGYLELARERTEDEGLIPLLGKAAIASDSIRRHLEFARDYQNMGTKRPQWIDVQAACRRTATSVELKGVKVVAEVGGLEIFSDPMLEKVFYNLIDNSIKHGQKTTRISFSYSTGADGMRLVYEDDGVGVPDGDKATIFERSMGDRDGRRGYGLYLAKEILGITGIELSETGKEGVGARFEMLIPRGKYRTKREPDKRKGVKHGRRP